MCLMVALGCMSAMPPAEAKAECVNVYNWGVYISDGSDDLLDVNAAFTEATGIEVNYSTYDSNETLYTKLKTGGSNYDVIIPSDYMIGRLIDEGMLEKLNFSNIPNFEQVSPAFRNPAFDPTNEYSVPYMWGTVGLIYNTYYIDPSAVTGWGALWNPAYADKILMFDNPRDAFAAAQLYLGYSLNTQDPEELRACTELLKEQHPFVQSYVMDEIFGEMERAEAWIAPYYAGDFITMHQENEDLAFCFPEEGFNLYTDAMCIPTCCQNKSAAEAYINFMCSFEAAVANASYTGYGSPIEGVAEELELTDYEYSVAYPSDDILALGQPFFSLPTETNELMDSLWLEVRASNTGWVRYAVYTLIVVGAASAFLITRSVKKKRRAARRRARTE